MNDQNLKNKTGDQQAYSDNSVHSVFPYSVHSV